MVEPGSRGFGPAPPQGTLLTFPSASAFTAILPILRFMVREMTARHFLPSFIPLLRAASSGAALLGSSSGIWQREGRRRGEGALGLRGSPGSRTPKLGMVEPPGLGEGGSGRGCGRGGALTFSSRLKSFSLATGELTLALAKSLKLLERWRESWGQMERGEGSPCLAPQNPACPSAA